MEPSIRYVPFVRGIDGYIRADLAGVSNSNIPFIKEYLGPGVLL